MEFPETFKFGTSTVAHQVEGKWSGDGNLEFSMFLFLYQNFEIKYNVNSLFRKWNWDLG